MNLDSPKPSLNILNDSDGQEDPDIAAAHQLRQALLFIQLVLDQENTEGSIPTERVTLAAQNAVLAAFNTCVANNLQITNVVVQVANSLLETIKQQRTT